MKICLSKCPQCEEENEIDWGDINIDGNQAWQKAYCYKCETNFIEIYKYIGTEITKKGINNDKRGKTSYIAI